MPCTANNQAAPQQQNEPSDLTVKTGSLVNYNSHTSPPPTEEHSVTSHDPQASEVEPLMNGQQTTHSFTQSPKSATMEGTDSVQPGTASTEQQQEHSPRPSLVTLETAKKPHEHPLEWTDDLTPSWYPKYSATAPEICLWASAPWHIREREWVKAASTEDVSDTVRVASVLRRAESTLYEVPANIGLRYPEFARGHSARSRSSGPHYMFPSGSKGLKQLDPTQIPAEDMQGARYIAAGYYFVPSPSKLTQMVTATDLESDETASGNGQGRTFGVKGGFRPRPLALNNSLAPRPLTTPWVPEPEFEEDMEDVPLTSPSPIPEDVPPGSPPSSPPRFADDVPGDYHGPIDQFPGDISDDSDESVYSDEMDPFLDIEPSDHAELDALHEYIDDQEGFDDDFEPESMGCWSTAAHVRLEAANEDQRQDLIDSIHDSCDHAHFATDKPEQLTDLPPGYRWTAHSFALHHSGPRLIVYAPPPDDYEFDDRVSDIGSDGTSEFASSPVKMMQGNRAPVWAVPIPEEDEEDEEQEIEVEEPLKTLYEGFLEVYGSEFGQANAEQEVVNFARPFSRVRSLMDYLGALFQSTTQSP